MRYTIGGEWLDRVMKFAEKPITLTPFWDEPMSSDRTRGNVFYHFYDRRSTIEYSVTTLTSHTHIDTRGALNHPNHTVKHPAGVARLQSVNEVGGWYFIFDPLNGNILSPKELDKRLREVYNNDRIIEDKGKLELYRAT
ncbi:hypothetical protein GQ44DRAFT_755698 [Phaeosphaeriaceae sp. PMI808]|nr:hypothetical protein GQ44DRAFT_755698 [Phaeosphaeriaceae sp. PMI808]